MGQPSGGGYVSIRRNAESTSAKFGYDKSTGYFGDKHPRSKPKTREIISNSPAKDARELFRQIAKGGVKEDIPGLKGQAVRLPEGTLVTLRPVTSSSGSPAVEINIKETIKGSKVRTQKIHFRKGE
jgi:hypothetical protein